MPGRRSCSRTPGPPSSTTQGEVTHKVDYPLTTDVADPVERFRSLLYTHGGDDIYGVIPMSVLRQVKPFDSYHWADRTFVGELTLQGPFHNVPEYLYFRRDHPNRTTRVGNRSIRVRCSQLDPARANRWRHPVIRLLGEYILGFFSAINRAPISRRDRWRCRKVLVLWILGHANPMYRLKFLSSPDLAAPRGRRVIAGGPGGQEGELRPRAALLDRTPGEQDFMTRPVRRVGLYGYLGSGNLGNDASLEAVLTWLSSTYPDLELRCITIAPDEVQARYGIRSVPLALELRAHGRGPG